MTFREDSARSRGGFQRDPSSDATPPRPDPTRRETIRKEHPSPSLTSSLGLQGGELSQGVKGATDSGGRAATVAHPLAEFAFTPMPPNATPAQECAIWMYDDLRLDEAGF